MGRRVSVDTCLSLLYGRGMYNTAKYGMPPTVLDMSEVPVGDRLICKNCGTEHSKETTNKFVFWSGVSWGEGCPGCGRTISKNTVITPLRPQARKMLDLDVCRTQTWYHYTESKDWPVYHDFYGNSESGTRNFWAHVGTYESARDRAMTLESTGGVVHAVMIKSGALWSPDILADDGWLHDIGCVPGEFEVRRYLNRFEAPGTISLAVCNEILEVVDTLHPGW